MRPLETRAKVVLAEAADARAFGHLRTVDDVAILSAQPSSVGGLRDLSSLISDGEDLKRSIEIAKRADRVNGEFSITVSAAHTPYGAENLIEDAVARAISAATDGSTCTTAGIHRCARVHRRHQGTDRSQGLR